MSELIWVAVPARAGVAVVIVPRLTGSGDLGVHGLDRWPEIVRATRFDLAVRRGGEEETLATQPTFDGSTEAMLERWLAVFSSSERNALGVEPHSVNPPTRHDPVAITLSPTTEEVTGLLAAYASEVSGQDPAPELAGLESFAARRAERAAPGLDGDRRDARPTLDFHALVALYREHPRVLRALGLIVDLTVALPAGVEAIRVSPALPPWPGGTPPSASRPWTRCSLADGRLVATPRAASPLTRRGLVDLRGTGLVGASQNARWAVVTFDVDGAMAHLPPADRGELAGLRSAGLGLVRKGHEADLRTRAGRGNAPGSADDTELHADDLVLGYRLDVRDDAASGWSPLCERRAQYEIAGAPLDAAAIVEEGHVKPDALISDPSGGLGGDEVIARWDGWSLAAPRPVPADPAPSKSASSLSWMFEPVPPLPRLRFGRTYRLRARAADLAGGGLTMADLGAEATPLEATEPLFYGRVEPVPAPLVLPPASFGPGDALERLVVRSRGGPPPPGPDPDIPEEFAPPPPPPDPYPDRVTRRIAPPPVSVELAEQHGVFDGLTPEASFELARRAMGDFAREDGDGPLPDPLAHEWCARLPGGQPVHHAWPVDGAPVALTLRRGEGTALFPDGAGAVVFLPPAAQLTLSLSSAPDRAGLNGLALPRWVAPGLAASVAEQVLAGAHPHITPARGVQVVHAVQRPLQVPGGSVGVHRDPGSTSVLVTRIGTCVRDSASTGQIDLVAQWNEWGDAPAPIGTRTVPVTSQIVPASGPFFDPLPRQELGDTRRRRIAYTATAISRFQEHFDPALLETDPGAFSLTGPAMVVDVPSSARPEPPAVRHTVPAFGWEGAPPPPGWQEWRHVRRGGLARVHMGPGWFSSGEGELLGLVVSRDHQAPQRIWPYLSQAGRDPTRLTPNPIHLLAPTNTGPTAGLAVDVELPEAGRELTVMPFEPWPDPAGGGWLCDVDLGQVADVSYCPFFELALCRYQPVSLDGCHLSQVVRTEMLQLLPTRELTLQRSAGSITVTLAGLGPGASGQVFGNQVEVWIERWTGDRAPTTEFTSLDAAPEVDAWVRVAGTARGALGAAIALAVPSDPKPQRVVVREVEPERFGVTGSGAPPLTRELGQRVVFLDSAALT